MPWSRCVCAPWLSGELFPWLTPTLLLLCGKVREMVSGPSSYVNAHVKSLTQSRACPVPETVIHTISLRNVLTGALIGFDARLQIRADITEAQPQQCGNSAGLAAMVELVSEPLYILAQVRLQLQVRVVAEAAATLVRGVLTLALLKTAACDVGIALSLAQVTYSPFCSKPHAFELISKSRSRKNLPCRM